MRPRPDRSAGFTLIELLVVIALIAVVTGLGLPIAYQNMSGLRARTAARELAATFRLARDLAVSSRMPHCVRFDAEDGRYTLLRDESDDRRLYLSEELLERRELRAERMADEHAPDAGYESVLAKELGRGVEFLDFEVMHAEEDADRPLMSFDPRGHTSGGLVVLGDRRAAWRIELSRAGGKVRIERLDEEWDG